VCPSFVHFVSSGKCLARVAREPVSRLRDVGKTGGSAPRARAAAPPRVTIIDRAPPRPAVRARATTATDDAATFVMVVCDVPRRAPAAARVADGPMRRKAAARFLGVAPDTVSNWRQRGTGPTFSWLQLAGRRVAVYERIDLERWQASQAARAAKPTLRDERDAARVARLPSPNALTYAEAAALIGFTEAEFRAQVTRGRGPQPCGRIGLRFFFRADGVRAWIATRPRLAAAVAARGGARAEVLGGAAQAEPLGESRRVDEQVVPADVDDREQVENVLDDVRVAGGSP
jgi:hypothetical protein